MSTEKDAGTKGRRKKCGKIYSDELVFSCPDKFLIREKSDCIQMSGDTQSYGLEKQDEKKFKIRRSVEFSSATARCRPWRVDGQSHGEPVATKEESGDVDLTESETGSEEDVTGKPVAYKTATAGNPMHPVTQTAREVQKLKRQNGHTIYK